MYVLKYKDRAAEYSGLLYVSKVVTPFCCLVFTVARRSSGHRSLPTGKKMRHFHLQLFRIFLDFNFSKWKYSYVSFRRILCLLRKDIEKMVWLFSSLQEYAIFPIRKVSNFSFWKLVVYIYFETDAWIR